MSILPNSTTFGSFFVALAVLFLGTGLLGLNMSAWIQRLRKLRSSESNQNLWFHTLSLPAWFIAYLRQYHQLLSARAEKWDIITSSDTLPYIHWFPKKILGVLYGISRTLPVLILRGIVLELNFPYRRWYIYTRRHNRFLSCSWHPLLFIFDVIRFLFLPVWFAVGLLILSVLILEDVIIAFVKLIFRLF